MNLKDIGNGRFLLNHIFGAVSAQEILLVDDEFGTDVKFNSANGSLSFEILTTKCKYPEIHISAKENVLLRLAISIFKAVECGKSTMCDGESHIVIRSSQEKTMENINENS
jgi:hypothetical protein